MTAIAPAAEGRDVRVWQRILAVAAVFAASAAVGIATMSRSVGLMDYGELAAVATTLGIAHPTGYPTFTLLGHFVTRLIPLRPLLALNLLAVLLVAAGAALLVPLYEAVLERIGPQPARTRPGGDARKARNAPAAGPDRRPSAPSPRATATVAGPERLAIAAVAALATALTATWWQQATGFEVYALHVVFLPLVTLLFLRWVDHGKGGLLFAFVLGLSFTNHMTTLLLAPAFLVYAAVRMGPGRMVGASLRIAPAFVVGLLPYVYLPLRAALLPRFDWGDPRTLDAFVRHVTGWQFRVWMFSNAAESQQQAAYLLARLPWDLGWLGLVPVVLGAAVLARRARAVGVMTLLLVAAAFVYACGYTIPDIESYTLAGVMGLGIALAAGLLAIRERYSRAAAIGFGAALVVACLAFHWRDSDERRDHMVDDMVHNVLEPLPRNAVLLSGMWDNVVSPSYYAQEVEGLRRDVLVVDPLLLRYNWYVRELAGRAPGPMKDAAAAAAAYVREEGRFERGEPYDGARVTAAYNGMVQGLLSACLARGRPLFMTPDVDVAMPAGVQPVPFQLTLACVRDTAYLPQEFPSYRRHPWPGRTDSYVATTAWYQGLSLYGRGDYEASHGHADLARRYRRYALTFDPGFVETRLPPQPAGGRDQILQSIGFFDRLRAKVAADEDGARR